MSDYNIEDNLQNTIEVPMSNNNTQENKSVEEQIAVEQEENNTVESIEEASGALEESIENDNVQEQLIAAQAKADENWDKYLRLQAELENVRRRIVKQLEDAHKFGARAFAESMLPVIDSIEMGLNAEGDLEAVREGMALTLKVLMDAMTSNQVEIINPEGEAFNPEQHQAVSTTTSEAHSDNDVISVMQKGYSLNGRLIRPAMVVVCKN